LHIDSPATSEQRNSGIDIFRGTLVLLVILGHFSELMQRQNLLTWMGFGFRMPLFIGLTGYLFNLERARAMPFIALFGKYYHRLIFPWLVACVVHLTLTHELTWFTPLVIILWPPFHMWFVPVMLAFIFCARISSLDRGMLLALAIPASIAAMYSFGVAHMIQQYQPWLPDRRYFIYPIYFTFGMFVARHQSDPSKRWLALCVAMIGLFWWARLYNQTLPLAEVAAELTLCIPLIGFLPWVRKLAIDVPAISSVGRDSLFFYLWHPLAFGLWGSLGFGGPVMLVLSLLSMVLFRNVVARRPRLRNIFGVQPPETVAVPPRAAPLDLEAAEQPL
jgi:fucose 4-O-acetylase-like acetyltransferase